MCFEVPEAGILWKREKDFSLVVNLGSISLVLDPDQALSSQLIPFSLYFLIVFLPIRLGLIFHSVESLVKNLPCSKAPSKTSLHLQG